jgi:hypothetical protein
MKELVPIIFLMVSLMFYDPSSSIDENPTSNGSPTKANEPLLNINKSPVKLDDFPAEPQSELIVKVSEWLSAAATKIRNWYDEFLTILSY